MLIKMIPRKNLKNMAAKSGQRVAPSDQCPSEHVEHRNFVSMFKKTYPGVMIFSIPNGGKRGKITAQKLKLEGLLPGVPDLFVPEWGIWIEMKRVRGGSLSPAQKSVIPELERIGYTVIIGYGCDDAMQKVKALNPNPL